MSLKQRQETVSEHQCENLIQSLRGRDTWKAVSTQGPPVAALLKLDEANHCLGFQDDETDRRDELTCPIPTPG